MQEGLVRRSKEVVGLLERHVLRSALRRQSTGSSLLSVLHIDKVDLHLLLCPHADDKGRTLAGSNDLMWVVYRLQEQTVGALKLLDDRLGERDEVNVWVRIVDVLGELRNGFGVRLGLESKALALEERLEFLVVCDDAVVDDGELPIGIRPVAVAVSSNAQAGTL